ncbi:hypothetical protein DFH08DRAFT_953921 [Mycena albidolilacea]|uniref:Uncharacterized protein n=1 Tax=Mycena albidolilacea TaxID=1033008 RepID=A0AAD7EZL7_9AGAR|nr:hypothetical protein DFH08DRAFT_953921 [Mycena albidolilacea]
MVKSTQCMVNVVLCTCLALMRVVFIEYPDCKFWNKFNKRLAKVRADAGGDPKKLAKFTPCGATLAVYSHTTSAFLLVCKDWLRVATPLLYNVVIIRSKAQAQALEAALKSNKDLGAFIKKLRVEGGYGLPMKTILKASPNITDLFLSLAIWSSDGVSGLCQSLHLIDPVRLILYDSDLEPRDNKQNLQLVGKVVACIQFWKRLKTIDIPYSCAWADMNSRCSSICAALKTSPSVEEVVIHVSSFVMTEFITEFRQSRSIKKVKLKLETPMSHAWSATLREEIDADINLKDFVQVSTSDFDCPAEIARAPDPSFVPMESASQEIQDKIWERVLYFALDMEELGRYMESDVHTIMPNHPELRNQLQLGSATNAMRVSKQFNRLSTPFVYEHVDLLNVGDLSRFSASLMRDRTIAKRVKSFSVAAPALLLTLPDFVSLDSVDEWFRQQSPQELLLPVLRLLDGLVVFTVGLYDATQYPPRPQFDPGTMIVTWAVLQTLAEVAGATLRRLLSALRRIYFHANVTPNAKHFFERHGGKLTEILIVAGDPGEVSVLDACPTLPRVICRSVETESTNTLPPIKLLSPSQPHLHLAKLVLDINLDSRKEEKTMGKFFDSLDTTLFPVLREIQAFDLSWPTTEREIAKCPWVQWAEQLLSCNIKLTDQNGKHWTCMIT